MTGAEHFAEAARLAAAAGDALDRLADTEDDDHDHLLAHVHAGTQLAQVHATLALVAATVRNMP